MPDNSLFDIGQIIENLIDLPHLIGRPEEFGESATPVDSNIEVIVPHVPLRSIGENLRGYALDNSKFFLDEVIAIKDAYSGGYQRNDWQTPLIDSFFIAHRNSVKSVFGNINFPFYYTDRDNRDIHNSQGILLLTEHNVLAPGKYEDLKYPVLPYALLISNLLFSGLLVRNLAYDPDATLTFDDTDSPFLEGAGSVHVKFCGEGLNDFSAVKKELFQIDAQSVHHRFNNETTLLWRNAYKLMAAACMMCYSDTQESVVQLFDFNGSS